MTSNRSLIRLALKKGIKSDFKIIDFVSIHPDCYSTKESITDTLNDMIESNEIIFNKKNKHLSLSGYPIKKEEGKVFVK